MSVLTFIRALVCVLLLCTSSTCLGGNIPGELTNSFGMALPNVPTSVAQHGFNAQSNQGAAMRTLSGGSNQGVFYFPDLAAGNYSQVISEADNYGIIYRDEIAVPSSGDASWTVLRHSPSISTYGTFFPAWPAYVWQSFRATASSLYSASVRCAGSTKSVDIEVSVWSEDRQTQIGPTRQVPCNSMNAQAAYWSHGDIPLQPQEVYVLRFNAVGAAQGNRFSPWTQTVSTQLRSAIPDGTTWIDTQQSLNTLETVIDMSDDGIINTMAVVRCTSRAWTGPCVGQTFTSQGTAVLAVTFAIQNTWSQAPPWIISLHEDMGSDGCGGAQIASAKYTMALDYWDGRAGVAWGQNEAPTKVGQMYFVKVAPVGYSAFSVETADADTYTQGACYANGVKQDFDLALGVYQLDPQYNPQLQLVVQDVNVELGTNDTTISWQTNLPASSVVQFSTTTPYQTSVRDTALVTAHRVTVTGLEWHTLYHYRVVSVGASGQQVAAPDALFATEPSLKQSNLLQDASFESGSFKSWTLYNHSSGDCRFISSPWEQGAQPLNSTYAFACAGTPLRGGVYQRVPIPAGSVNVSLTAWLWTATLNGNLFVESAQTSARVGVDSMGGIDSNSSSIVWTQFASSDHQYCVVGLNAVPIHSSAVTVFLEGGCGSAGECVFAYDVVTLTS